MARRASPAALQARVAELLGISHDTLIRDLARGGWSRAQLRERWPLSKRQPSGGTPT